MEKRLFFWMLFITIAAFSQENETPLKKNEVKTNAFNVLIFKTIDLSYEYLINEESSVGTSILFNMNNLYSDTPYYNETFAFTPFYRRYFSKKICSGILYGRFWYV